MIAEIRKVLLKISLEKGCEAIKEWIKPCERHLYWSATSTFNGNGAVIWAKFKSFLSHIINKHKDLPDLLFNRCAHKEIQPRRWLSKRISFVPKCLYIWLREIPCALGKLSQGGYFVWMKTSWDIYFCRFRVIKESMQSLDKKFPDEGNQRSITSGSN